MRNCLCAASWPIEIALLLSSAASMGLNPETNVADE
jgi:hypothetical protein